jgi:hypothetical protein
LRANHLTLERNHLRAPCVQNLRRFSTLAESSDWGEKKPYICLKCPNRSLGLISSNVTSTQASAADPMIVEMIL